MSLGRWPRLDTLLSCLHRENFLVLDVFFEALTSEALEQRAAYGLSALLGETRPRFHGGGSAQPAPSDSALVIHL